MHNLECLEIWYTDRRCKGASWYQVWLESSHASVSCGPRSWHTTPVNIWTGRPITQFLCIHNFVVLLQNSTIFAVEMPSTISTPHSKFQLNHSRRFWDMNSKIWLSFFHFFLLFCFCKGIKVTMKWKLVIWLPCNLVLYVLIVYSYKSGAWVHSFKRYLHPQSFSLFFCTILGVSLAIFSVVKNLFAYQNLFSCNR